MAATVPAHGLRRLNSQYPLLQTTFITRHRFYSSFSPLASLSPSSNDPLEHTHLRVEKKNVSLENTHLKIEKNKAFLENTHLRFEKKDEENNVSLENTHLKIEKNKVFLENTHLRFEKKDEENNVSLKNTHLKIEKNKVFLENTHLRFEKKDEENNVSLKNTHLKIEKNKVFLENTHLRFEKKDGENNVSLENTHLRVEKKDEKNNVSLENSHLRVEKKDEEKNVALKSTHLNIEKKDEKKKVDLENTHLNIEKKEEKKKVALENTHLKIEKKSVSFYPKRGQILELLCESLAFKGKGICHVADTGFVVMCDRALPGERFIGRVSRKKNDYAEVTKLKTITPHWDMVDAPCEHSSNCGGCKTQNLLYEAQVKAKEKQVRELVVHVGKFSDKDLEYFNIMKPIVPCDIQFHYRNKMEFSFSNQTWVPEELLETKQSGVAGYALGLHAPGFFDKVLNVNRCLLQSEPANEVLKIVQDCWRDPELDLSPYNVRTHAGFFKHLMLRSGRDVVSGLPELMVNFVTSSYKPELLKPLVDKLSVIPEVVSIVNNVNTSVGNTSLGEEEYTLYGKSTITEMLRGLKFQISANSFFQTNSRQADVLYGIVEDYANLKGDGSEIVLDLFCGTGTIGLTLAKRVKHVYGYEVVPQAIADACRNAKLNNIFNATFVEGDLNKIDDNFGKNFPKPDIVISDPNRPGMHMKLIKFLLKLRAPRIIYVSCNPATCARDIDYLCHGVAEQNMKGCYQLKSLQPVDMFPHTPHIECVCLLELQ